jgi:hypothetical protein
MHVLLLHITHLEDPNSISFDRLKEFSYVSKYEGEENEEFFLKKNSPFSSPSNLQTKLNSF